ncbi:hypothetical protein KC356_g7715 [Hortaea werneckii]|nr:hypothetical protein KC356_g7715 [Hortaea werneckii]
MTSSQPRRRFRPVNTLASPTKPTFASQDGANSRLSAHSVDVHSDHPSELSLSSPSKLWSSPDIDMVRERDPSHTSSAQNPSPTKHNREPLANISTRMQSPSPNHQQQQSHPARAEDAVEPLKATPLPHPEFGQASPMRNPLKQQQQQQQQHPQRPQQRPQPSLFVPKKKPSPQQRQRQQQAFMSSAARQAQAGAAGEADALGSLPAPVDRRPFYLPGQKPQLIPVPVPGQVPAQPSRQQTYGGNVQLPHASNPPYQRPFQHPTKSAQPVAKPTNAAPVTSYPPSRPQFSSLGANTYYQPYQPPKPVIDLTKSNDGDDDGFYPDAALRQDSGKFGVPDPYMYVDAGQANDNIKNLLEGAFDDEEDKGSTRLRRRAKKAALDEKEKEAKSLADKLAGLSVKEEKKDEPSKSVEPTGEDEEEEEDGTVEGLSVKLLPHQVDGVSWMIDKEIGQRKKNGVLPHGGILADDMGLGKTVQSVALILTNSRPPPDAKPEHPKQKLPGKEVGKGTLVVAPLALIKQWEDEVKTKVLRSHALKVLVHHGPSRTKSSNELKKYDVVVTTYQTLTSEFAGSNMAVANGPRVGCFGVHWYRIMLDEAHSIKNRNAKSTLACCGLESWYRWCLTGTPMQNNLDELQSLIKFLRIKPYCELGNWKAQITQPMKAGRGGLAMKRLQFFLRAFMKRRTKDILKKDGALNFGGKSKGGEGSEKKTGGMQIVKREVLTVNCEFGPEEQAFYTKLQDRADKRLNEMMKEGQKTDYIGALVLLLRLRQACNHPHLIELAMNKDKDAMTTGGNTQSQQKSGGDGMDDLAALMGGVSVQADCEVCQAKLAPGEEKRCRECEEMCKEIGAKKGGKKGTQSKAKKEVKPKRKAHQLPDDSDEEEGEWIADGPEQKIDLGKAGGTDDEDAEGGGETLNSIDSERSLSDDEPDDTPSRARTHPRKPTAVPDSSEIEASDQEDNASEAESDDEGSFMGPSPGGKQKPSTKVRHLLRILHTETSEHKTIVFSQFTTMLDLIQPHLHQQGVRYVRYDGSMRNDAREAALHALRHDPKTRVLLCSLKCGSLGLNLTAASRVVILEPFWNPFVEEQAIDRVHRLNQTVDVKVFRLTVRDTVEERILALQERKRELAKAAIEGAGNKVGKLSMQEILGLFKHDAEHSAGGHDEDDREMWRKFGGEQRVLDGSADSPRTSTGGAGSEGGSGGGTTSDRRDRGLKPGKATYVEHDVYGRRW